ncbi:carboxypeptidase regulatory-like domain-containing protein [Rhodocytophaga rosea]|uniref:Carboxypeptidase regulatory-like domain-containing protein n=2 Tax=Rhodocytophaga rosea TaxID=2704465 RepID=A0A6C0GW61_9BACT|nr:carboxypeptidase regulatory-like domain-containing protein [Rhodocytophaga rosea]
MHILLYGTVLSFLLTFYACQPSNTTALQVKEGEIGGVVTGPKGPEAGVWVIAETTDLPTKYAKIVVTDDNGRYLIPELPSASYSVWVRGYGLVDSPKKTAKPGKELNLEAVVAPTPQAAAEYYPAGYWFSLLNVPDKNNFAAEGAEGNGFSPMLGTQAKFLSNIKSGTCLACHQLGSQGTRKLSESLGTFKSPVEAWERRLQSGQAGAIMTSAIHQVGRDGTLKMFADWTERIKAGELPPAPPRPQGIERNVVITQWDWADPKAYLHDVVSTDRRNPTVNANGPVYGALEVSADYIPVLDPKTHTTSRIPLTVRDTSTPSSSGVVMQPSPYWGTEAIWNSKTNVHNPMLDEKGRLWITATVRPADNPDCCKTGSDLPSAKLFPVNRAGRHLGFYDPATKKYTHISTCFSTHHLMFAEDQNNTLWTSGGGEVIGWLNTKQYLETGDEEKSQGWTALILDANGNGKRDEYVEPKDSIDPKKDKRIAKGLYSVAPAPDGSVWGSTLGYPGGIIRLNPGANPPETALVEYYELPLDAKGAPIEGFSPRGMDIDRNGIAWVALASGHMASFDRKKCGTLNGPNATGQHCAEGWTFYTEPLPQLKGVNYKGSAESSYYTWVDQFNTFGLGENTPINTGNESEGLLALKDGKWVVLRVPYPMGFYTKWMDGRIDDPKAGWKGKGLWATISTRAPFHMEGGKGNTSKVFKFQLRPDPLAR